MISLYDSVCDKQGYISPKKIAQHFHTPLGDVLHMAGVPVSAGSKPDRLKSTSNQGRLKTTLEIINQVRPYVASDLQAYAWYRSEPIAAFGNITPEAMVKMGKANAVKQYLDMISMGGFA